MKNKKLLLVLLASSVLAGCDKNSFVNDGSNPVAKVDDKSAILNLQDFYEDLKTSNGGSKAMSYLLDRLAELEYAKDGDVTKIKDFNETLSSGAFNVKSYRTQEKLNEEINDFFQDIIDGTSYNDDDGKFDANKYKDSIEDKDYELDEGVSTLITDNELALKLKYNYDEYIKEEVIPDIYEQYIYEDYLMGTNKYKSQFANQYGLVCEVLKIDNYTTALNSAWSQSFVNDIKSITVGANKESGFTFYSDSNCSFATSNSDGQLIEFKATPSILSYRVYEDAEGSTAISDLLENVYNRVVTSVTPGDSNLLPIENAVGSTVIEVESYDIDANTSFDSEFMDRVEDILIARKLYNIDQEVKMARDYDLKNASYNAYTPTQQTNAQSYASTYSSSNTKSIAQGAKESKISAQQTTYHSDLDTYTKSSYTSVLPSAISDLRGTTAKELISNLSEFNGEQFLLPIKDNLTSPVYLDGSYYYVCRVTNWYGYYVFSGDNIVDRNAPYKSIANYQIQAYQDGEYTEWVLNDDGTKYVEGETKKTKENQDIIDLVQVSAKAILTSSIRKEAVVALFSQYGLEINDQEVYDYIASQYPDYFEN